MHKYLCFYGELSKAMKENETLMVSVGTSRVAGSQAFQVKKGQRFITNPNTASMGFCLPAATGIAVAQPGKAVVCVTGEGSLQMNIQEMQTILQNRLPVKLFVINNQGYHSIRQTQQSYFKPPLVGVGEESGDLSFRIFPGSCLLMDFRIEQFMHPKILKQRSVRHWMQRELLSARFL